MQKRASEVIASGDQRAIVDFALGLNRKVQAASGELEEAKAHLRKLGRAALGEEAKSVSLAGNLGEASVAFPPDKVQTRSGMDLKDAEVNLTAEVFSRLFFKEIVIRPAKDFLAELASVSEADQARVRQFVEIVPTTPKVFLPL